MPAWLQAVLTGFYVLWLCIVAYLFWRLVVTNGRRADRQQAQQAQVQQGLLDSTARAQENNRISVEASNRSAHAAETLSQVLLAQHVPPPILPPSPTGTVEPPVKDDVQHEPAE